MGITSGIDPTGRYVNGRTYWLISDGRAPVPTIWHDGTRTAVPIQDADPILWAVNSLGHAVGSSFAGET